MYLAASTVLSIQTGENSVFCMGTLQLYYYDVSTNNEWQHIN